MGSYSSVDNLLNLASSTDNWFLHYRNCEFLAIKNSRAIVQRPYYLSPHLNPFDSSWLLLSKNYTMAETKTLDVRGMVLALQLEGIIQITLTPKEFCLDFCAGRDVLLKAGQALLFTTELWQFGYKTININRDEDATATFLQEIEWFN